MAASLALVSEFPRAQRLYVLFLEAADSHRLNSALVRCVRREPGREGARYGALVSTTAMWLFAILLPLSLQSAECLTMP